MAISHTLGRNMPRHWLPLNGNRISHAVVHARWASEPHHIGMMHQGVGVRCVTAESNARSETRRRLGFVADELHHKAGSTGLRRRPRRRVASRHEVLLQPATSMATSGQHNGHALRKAKRVKRPRAGEPTTPPVYSLKLLAFSICSHICEDVISFIKELAHCQVAKSRDCLRKSWRHLGRRGPTSGGFSRAQLHLGRVGAMPPGIPTVIAAAA